MAGLSVGDELRVLEPAIAAPHVGHFSPIDFYPLLEPREAGVFAVVAVVGSLSVRGGSRERATNRLRPHFIGDRAQSGDRREAFTLIERPIDDGRESLIRNVLEPLEVDVCP